MGILPYQRWAPREKCIKPYFPFNLFFVLIFPRIPIHHWRYFKQDRQRPLLAYNMNHTYYYSKKRKSHEGCAWMREGKGRKSIEIELDSDIGSKYQIREIFIETKLFYAITGKLSHCKHYCIHIEWTKKEAPGPIYPLILPRYAYYTIRWMCLKFYREKNANKATTATTTKNSYTTKRLSIGTFSYWLNRWQLCGLTQ